MTRRRQGGALLCPYDHKITFRRWRKAAGRNRRLNGDDGRVYWCAHAGGWHITLMTVAEYGQRRAAS